jgi:hypothetical protein
LALALSINASIVHGGELIKAPKRTDIKATVSWHPTERATAALDLPRWRRWFCWRMDFLTI